MATDSDGDGVLRPFTLINDTGRQRYPDFTSHRCSHMASIMGDFHNNLIRAFNSLYEQAGDIKPGSQDAANFLSYSQLVCEIVDMHHDWEETSYFPAVEAFAKEPGILGSNVAQHEAFENGLHQFAAYCKTAKDNYEAARYRELIDSFAQPLQQHLHEEPLTFYRLRHVDSEGLQKVSEEQDKIALAKADPWRILPFILGCRDVTAPRIDRLAEDIHKVPWYLPYLTYLIFSWPNRNLWRFGFSDFWGNPKTRKSL